MLEISGESSGEEELGLPEDVLGEAAEAEELMVPTKSRPAYENVYSQLIRECSTKQEISQPAGVGGIHVHGYANCTINIYHGGT